MEQPTAGKNIEESQVNGGEEVDDGVGDNSGDGGGMRERKELAQVVRASSPYVLNLGYW